MSDEMRDAFRETTRRMLAGLPALRDASRQLAVIAKAFDAETGDVHPDLLDAVRAEGVAYVAALGEQTRLLRRLCRRSAKVENLVWAHTPQKGC